MNPAEGLIVPVITPRSNKDLDTTGLKKLANKLIDHGVDGLFVLGTTGEFRYLSLKEKEAAIETIAEANNRRVALLVGASSETLSETQEVIRCAETNDADAIALALLYGHGSSVEKINSVLAHSHLPVVLYNNPAITDGENIAIDTVGRLSENPRIIGIKDSSGDPEYFNALLELANDHFAVLQGREKIIRESLRKGARGIVSGSANAFPGQFRDLLQKRTKATEDETLRCKQELERLSHDPIIAVKKKLVQTGVIRSADMFHSHF